MNDTAALLTAIRDSLARIEAMIGEATQRKKAKRKGNRTAARERGLCEQGRAASVEEDTVQRVCKLWQEICPNNPQPIFDDELRLSIASFWSQMKDADGVRAVFEGVARDKYWSGQSPRRGVSMRYVIKHPAVFLE